MRAPRLVERLGERLAVTPAFAVGLSAMLLVVSLLLALANERAGQAESIQQAKVQADILAGSIAAPLAFDDPTAMQEYLAALKANPQVEAAGAYDAEGRLAGGFRRIGDPPPPRNLMRRPHLEGGRVVVTAPVRQGTTQLGSVYLRVTTENLLRRATRYFGIGVIVLMSSLLVAVLGSSHASLREANRKLQDEIRERERAEEALRQAQKMEAMGQLTGGVAHDFNNLLMVASSGMDLLDRTTDPVRRERLKQGIRQAIDRGADLTQQLLAFARKTPLKTEVVDLRSLLAGMRDVLERSLREDITVRVEAEDGLWPVEVDPSQFEVAVLNMAINARDAMPNGGQITIRLQNAPAGAEEEGEPDRVRVAIQDAGVGMPPELLSRIFEPFFTTKGVGQGTGLGLAQVYGFARASGGEVVVDSKPGEGATFTLLLPRSEKRARTAAVAAPDAAASGEQQRRLLLVEDDDRVAELVGEMLKELGYDCVRVSDAASALQVVRSDGPFDLVFSDMVMPGEASGLDLARQIISERPELPVVLTTGYSASASAAAAEGMRVLLKPYRIEALASALEEALGGAHSAQATG